jgi:ribonuclease VapC
VVVDTSALIAIVRNEPETEAFVRAIAVFRPARLSAASYLEAGIVIDSGGEPAFARRLDRFLAAAGVAIEPVTAEQATVAREAYRDYGRGSGHPAKLNFGDCFSYALARVTGEPLLFKGNDFIHTDLTPAIAPA